MFTIEDFILVNGIFSFTLHNINCLYFQAPLLLPEQLHQVRVPDLPPQGENVPAKLSLQHLHVRLAKNQCYSSTYSFSLLEEKVAVPWEKNPRERSPGIEDDKPAEEQFCGAPECSRKCSAGEWCANSGTECQEYPCCSSSKCVTFNSQLWQMGGHH